MRALQTAWERNSAVRVVVSVVSVSFRETAEVAVHGLPGRPGPVVRPRPTVGSEPWRGFQHIEEKSQRQPKPHPWILASTIHFDHTLQRGTTSIPYPIRRRKASQAVIGNCSQKLRAVPYGESLQWQL
jgi:hypothetical protein